MFELARGYAESGMAAYSQLQQAEFASEAESGYQAVKHQQFVGTKYFDDVAQCVASGRASTVALKGSTEEEQFSDAPHTNGHSSSHNSSPQMPSAPAA
jgi:isocitrate lyase